MAGGMGICEKPVDGDDGEEDEAKVQVQVHLKYLCLKIIAGFWVSFAKH